MAEQNPKGEPHPTIPHLYRKPQPRTPGRDLYPYLQSEDERRAREREEEVRRKEERGR
jgi:hypothetical protein